MEQGNKKLINQVLIFVVVFGLAFFGTDFVMSRFNATHNKLKKVAVEMNKKTPQLIDAETRLDSVTVDKETLQYHYTLVNITKGDGTINTEEAQRFIKNNAQNNLDTNPKMNDFRDWHVALSYTYNDKNRKPLFNFTITSKTDIKK